MDDKMVPLKALQEERRKFKLKLNKLEEEKKEKPLKEEDIEEVIAQSENDYLIELAELVQNPYYADSAQKIPEIREYARNNHTSLKNAYNILFAESKFDEIKRRTEEDMQNKINAKQATAITALTTGSNANAESKPKLTEAQREAARLYGMTEEEYWRYI
jgi:hypothetical protein